MINIITKSYSHDIKNKYSDKKLVSYPWLYFDEVCEYLYKNSKFIEVERALKEIDGCEIVENQDNPIFISKFNGVPLRLSYSSEGAQIVLYLQYLIFTNSYKDKVVDITNCGGNAIKFILKYFNDYDLTLCLRHNQLGLDMECTFMANGEEVSSLREILNYEK